MQSCVRMNTQLCACTHTSGVNLTDQYLQVHAHENADVNAHACLSARVWCIHAKAKVKRNEAKHSEAKHGKVKFKQ